MNSCRSSRRWTTGPVPRWSAGASSTPSRWVFSSSRAGSTSRPVSASPSTRATDGPGKALRGRGPRHVRGQTGRWIGHRTGLTSGFAHQGTDRLEKGVVVDWVPTEIRMKPGIPHFAPGWTKIRRFWRARTIALVGLPKSAMKNGARYGYVATPNPSNPERSCVRPSSMSLM